jgi:hypothetical protein
MAEMTAEEAAEWGKTLDFPTVWAALLKLGERIDRAAANTEERNKELDKKIAETTANINKMGENVDKMAKRVDRVTANVGGLNLSMGELIETLFTAHLGEKFDAYHYDLRRTYTRVRIYDDTNRLRSDIDMLLSNTTRCMIVEVKRSLDQKSQVDDHVKRMDLIRRYPPAEVKGKKMLGAMAGAAVEPEVREYAEQSGFFVLELSGEDVRLLEPPEGFKPKEWQACAD